MRWAGIPAARTEPAGSYQAASYQAASYQR
jgi:hypothetical protein